MSEEPKGVIWEPKISSAKEMPKDVDTTSSAFKTYLRKDQVPYEQYEGDELVFTGWKYLETEILNADYVADYIAKLVEQNELLKEQNEALKAKVEEDNLIIMGGLAETFETLIGEGANG